MRPVLAWLAVNTLLVGMNLLAAIVLYGLFRYGQKVAPDLMDEPPFVIALGLLGVVASIWVSIWAVRLISRKRR